MKRAKDIFEKFEKDFEAGFLIHILFKSLVCPDISIDVRDSVFIGSIKAKIYEQERIPIDKQHLVFNGKQLKNNMKVSDYNIENDSIIHLVIPLLDNGITNLVSSHDPTHFTTTGIISYTTIKPGKSHYLSHGIASWRRW